MMWENNAQLVRDVYGGVVDWQEGFYFCPECGEPVYYDDWGESDLEKVICPICGFKEDTVKP